MAGEDTKKAPEKADGEKKTPEAQKPTASPEKQVTAAARLEWKDFMSKEGLDRMQKIQDRKKQIDEEQKKLKEETAGKNSKESWVSDPDKNSESSAEITTEVEEALNEPGKKQLLEKMGLTDGTNMGALKSAITGILIDYLHKIGINMGLGTILSGGSNEKERVKGIVKDYAKNMLLTKIQYLFGELSTMYEGKKHGYGKSTELLEGFSTFTKTDFMKNGYLQSSKLKDFLLLEKSNYETFVGNFGKSLGLTVEKKQLEGEETTLMGKKLEPKELIDQKKLTFNKIRFTAPKDGKELDKVLQAEIVKALPPIDDAAVKQKVVDYLAGEIKKLNPQPDEIFELSPDGKWTKIDMAAENKSKDDAKTDAEKQAAETTTAGTENKPFNLTDSFKGIGDTIMEFFKWLMGLFGMKFGAAGVDEFVKEWKDVTSEERTQLKEFYADGKKFFNKTENLDKFMKNQDEARRVLALKKSDTKTNETWTQWIQRHISKPEQEQISFSTTLEPKGVANMFLSENGPSDPPSAPLDAGAAKAAPGQPKQDPDVTYKPGSANPPSSAEKPGFLSTQEIRTMGVALYGNEPPKNGEGLVGQVAQMDAALDKMDKSPEMTALKAVLDAYILKNAPAGLATKFKAAKDKGEKIYLDGYGEILIEIHLQKDPNLRKKLDNGEISASDIAQIMYKDLYAFTMAQTKKPEEKQKATATLEKFKKFVDDGFNKKLKPKPASPEKKQVTS